MCEPETHHSLTRRKSPMPTRRLFPTRSECPAQCLRLRSQTGRTAARTIRQLLARRACHALLPIARVGVLRTAAFRPTPDRQSLSRRRRRATNHSGARRIRRAWLREFSEDQRAVRRSASKSPVRRRTQPIQRGDRLSAADRIENVSRSGEGRNTQRSRPIYTASASSWNRKSWSGAAR